MTSLFIIADLYICLEINVHRLSLKTCENHVEILGLYFKRFNLYVVNKLKLLKYDASILVCFIYFAQVNELNIPLRYNKDK